MVLAGQDKWRKHPIFSSKGKIFPGLKEATAIFAVYCVGEFIYEKATAKKIDVSTLRWEKSEVGSKPDLAQK